MTQKLTTIGHRTAFNNEESPYRIVGYERPRNDNAKQFKREKMAINSTVNCNYNPLRNF